MRAIPGFVIDGAPRTKKNSGRIVTIPAGRRCRFCGVARGFSKLLPSEAHEEWYKSAITQAFVIKALLAGRGVELPISGAVSVECLVYCENRNIGDVAGYYQAVGDFLQSAGIIVNDSQIEDWDGSRRAVDKHRPRIEIYITVVNERPLQLQLKDIADEKTTKAQKLG